MNRPSSREKLTDPRWEATWDDARRQAVVAGLAATPAQRLAWLEGAIELAFRSGAQAPPFDNRALESPSVPGPDAGAEDTP